MKNPTHFRAIQVAFHAASGTGSARLHLRCQHWPHRKERVNLGRDFKYGNAVAQAASHLRGLGFRISGIVTVCKPTPNRDGSEPAHFLILTEDFARSIKDGREIDGPEGN